MKILFSAYRLDQYTDPDAFHVNIGIVLEQYPVETILFVTDPRTGIQRRCNWPPTVKEVVDACDQHIQGIARANKFRNWGSTKTIAGPQESRPTLAEMQAKYGKDWGLGHQERSGAKGFDWDEAAKKLTELAPASLRQD